MGFLGGNWLCLALLCVARPGVHFGVSPFYIGFYVHLVFPEIGFVFSNKVFVSGVRRLDFSCKYFLNRALRSLLRFENWLCFFIGSLFTVGTSWFSVRCGWARAKRRPAGEIGFVWVRFVP